MALRRRVHQIVEVAAPNDRISRIFDLSIISLIVLNVVAMILESVPSIRAEWEHFFRYFEYLSVAVFTLEYLARIWSCVESPRFASTISGRLRFAATPMAIIDLLAILPAFLPFIGIDLRVLRSLRVFRIIRIAKLGRYSRALQMIAQAFKSKREHLITSAFFMLVLILIAASLMYYAERDAQPDHFDSIPSAMWWSVVTLTTVGYGDVYPVTPIGRLLAAVMAILGVGMVALPTSILGAGFIEQMSKPSPHAHPACPHCGRSL